MASIKRRRGKYHVVYYYFNECGEKKQKWESFNTEAEAKHRKADDGHSTPSTPRLPVTNMKGQLM